ncbi:MAG: SDR family NAD(P)-dependent oxidoreductase [Actinobacteria bacterium]|nr:SDR family NAD(P)-dependent oxidoreductase [Actinomycetota bacterium]
MDRFSLRDSAVFITGGGQGIGLAIARAFAGEGAKLALVDLDPAALDRARAELREVTDVATFVLDVRDRDAFARVADEAEDLLGPVDVVCNNAGVGGGAGASTMTYEAWDWVLDINLGGVVNGVQTFVPRLIERGRGHIVNTASIAGLAPVAGKSSFIYATSKYAVVGLSELLRIDLEARGVGVSVLCPGRVATQIFENTAKWSPMAREMTDHKRKIVTLSQAALATGTPADEVGRLVLDGVKENRFYLITDDTAADAVALRTDELLAAMPGRRDAARAEDTAAR